MLECAQRDYNPQKNGVLMISGFEPLATLILALSHVNRRLNSIISRKN
jgi:hypothetical protein